MARATGFNQASLVAFILAGVKPIIPRWQMITTAQYQALPSGKKLQPISVNLEIKAKDLSFKELREIYQGIRKQQMGTKTKPLNKKHLALYRLVQEHGGPPRNKGVVKFWEEIMEKLNQNCPPDQLAYNTWKVVEMAYDRIVAQLETGVIPSGGKP